MKYSKQRNEIMYQVDLYLAVKSRLVEWGSEYEVQLEYRHEDCIFDFVVAKNDKIVLIIETKKLKDGSLPKYNTPQIKKYSRFGVPLVICGHNKKISKVADKIVLFVTFSQPGEFFHNVALWDKHLVELKFMATTKERKMKSSPIRPKKKKYEAI